jgi:hypothetical protein
VLSEFLADPATSIQVVDTHGGHTLVWVAQDHTQLAAVAARVDALFGWLGAPGACTLHLWWRDDPRHIEADEWPTRRTVNGGWAIPGDTTIVVYRQEEWERVMIHECIHAFEWDWTLPHTPLPCWGFTDKDRLMPYLAEAWTELYAEWLVCAWWGTSWTLQRDWQDAQAIQVLARAARRPHWDEETNIFAYYVLKAALAPHIEFLLTCSGGRAEWDYVLCSLVTPTLVRFRAMAATTAPVACSMRMARGK